MQAFADLSPDGASARDLADHLELSPQARKKASDLLNKLQSIGLLRRSGEIYRLARGGRVLTGVLRQRRRKTITFIPDLLTSAEKDPFGYHLKIPAEPTTVIAFWSALPAVAAVKFEAAKSKCFSAAVS